MKKNLISGQEYIKADTSGVVSYKIDGLEEEFSTDKFDNFTKKLLESYNLKTGQMIPASTEARKNC